ncbi:MAG: hypothetical protein EB078_03335 [Proteobacteria bacterium]|nr:hypothetical protein [Pseudomonadota bacterium]NDC23722.1 hypothetical protein [Pseudomonadota bacterium]NDD03915.1 hypothetical protein [Pseudomonadota bacterium]NDG26327.1 hypothetical protein [Pseudomonadota bacterium]
MFLRCPNPDDFLALVSVPEELSRWSLLKMKAHLGICSHCKQNFLTTQTAWQQYFKPEPDITSSILKVYSRLQSDETLVLKGWKLDELKRSKEVHGFLLSEGWLFRGGVFLGLGALVGAIVFSTLSQNPFASEPALPLKGPLAQIRLEEKNKVKVHYLHPELLHTIEFETSGGNR